MQTLARSMYQDFQRPVSLVEVAFTRAKNVDVYGVMTNEVSLTKAKVGNATCLFGLFDERSKRWKL